MTMLSSAPCTSSDLGFFSPSKPLKTGASTANSVAVSTRISRKPVQPQRSSNSSLASLPLSSPTSCSSSPLSSPPPPNPSKKRKSLPVDSYQTSLSSTDLPRAVKRLRSSQSNPKITKRKSSSSSKTSSRASSRRLSSPEPIYRSDRSRSTSLYPTIEPHTPTFPRRWSTDEDGRPGSEHLSSEMVVAKLVKSYKTFFTNPDDSTDTKFEAGSAAYPVVELEYPNNHASEKFILLAPKDKDHYNPIMDLERTLYTIVECYLTKDQQALFGPIPSTNLSESITPPPSPSPSPPCSIASTASTSSLSSLASSESSLTSLSSTSSAGDHLPILRAVQRAIHLQHGPLFIKAMARANRLLQAIKYPATPTDAFTPTLSNPMISTVETWDGCPRHEKILMRIIEENYQRTVGPNVPSLRRYEAFSSTVYGELMPSLIQEIIKLTGLNEKSLFLDLGSGVGNVVVQASLHSGCTSYGIELMEHPARVADDMLKQAQIRCRMWGVTMGKVELEKGDMLTSRRLDELIPRADVVLVDNKVFEESLNEALRPKFLDLKEGAYVVSLKPFVSAVNARVTKRNVDDMSAIFHVEEKQYHPGSVSWGNSGGSYFIHRVDRDGYARLKQRFDTQHGSSTRSSRSRR